MKMEVKQSSIVINDYNLGDNIKIENMFSIWNPISFISYFKGIHYDEATRQLYLPRGLDVYYLENTFNTKANIQVGKHDRFSKIEPVVLKFAPRDDVQREALRFMVGVNEYKHNSEKSQIAVNLNTGKGKTYCSIATIAYLQMRAAIITSSLGWLEQWSDCIQEYTDIKAKEIYTISGSGSIHRLLKRDPKQYKYFLISHSTIRSYGETNGWDKVTELFKHLEIGVKLYDEAHLNFDNIAKIDFYSNTYKTYYVTATPSRSNDDENRIFQLYFKNIPGISLFDENKDPHTHYKALRFRSMPSPLDISNCKGSYGLDRNKYIDYITQNDNFYNVLHMLMMSVVPRVSGKILFFIGTNVGINRVVQWVQTYYPEYAYHIGIYTSTTPEHIKEQQLDRKIIFSTTKSCGAAVDIDGLELTIVLAEPFKSEVIARQTLGRTRADNTNYIEIVDDSFKYIKNYYNYKKPIFQTYALSCNEAFINESDLKYKGIKAETYLQQTQYPIKRVDRDTGLFNPIERVNK